MKTEKISCFPARMIYALFCICRISDSVAAILEVGPSGYSYTAIQPAINDANTLDTVLVHDGSYIGGLTLSKDIMVKSVNGPECTIIQSAGIAVRFFKSGSNTIFEGFTVTGATNSGISCFIACPVIRNCIITNNIANQGGGMNLYRSWPIVENCQIVHNISTGTGGFGGGGIYSLTSQAPTFRNCIISDNLSSGYDGGGIYSYGPIVLVDCIIANNSTSYYPNTYYYGGGGGIFLYNDDIDRLSVIANCLISGNYAENTNCGMCGGGWILTDANTKLSVINTTIVNNTTYRGSGGGMCILGNDVTIDNCILWGNKPGGQMIFISNNSSVTVSNTDIEEFGYEGSNGNICQDPRFVDSIDMDFHLKPGSPCIENGDDSAVLPEMISDIAGRPRFRDGNCDGIARVDMGAYEFSLADFGDFDGNCSINMSDAGILARAWLSEPGNVNWNPVVDIQISPDSVIDGGDLVILAEYWMTEIESIRPVPCSFKLAFRKYTVKKQE